VNYIFEERGNATLNGPKILVAAQTPDSKFVTSSKPDVQQMLGAVEPRHQLEPKREILACLLAKRGVSEPVFDGNEVPIRQVAVRVLSPMSA
jgi:hypothetical protein